MKKEFTEVQKLISAFSELAGVGCTLTKEDFSPIIDVNSCGSACPMCSCREEYKRKCRSVHEYAAIQAERFGGKYLYFCLAGFMFCIMPIIRDDIYEYLLAGPCKATEQEDYSPGNVIADDTELYDSMMNYAGTLSLVAPDRINKIVDIMELVRRGIGDIYNQKRMTEVKIQLSREIGDFIQEQKSRLISESDSACQYPYDREKQLTYAIMSGNKEEAGRLLNEILGYIFLKYENNLDSLKVKAMELTVLISRAAMNIGSGYDETYQMSLSEMKNFFEIQNFDEVCVEVTSILHKFKKDTFMYGSAKHADILNKAIKYMKQNYMHKISLEDVANHVYISPSYMSKIFKDEMKTSFSNCLNQIRIEKSCVLLLNEELSLSEIAELVGFVDQSYFNKIFKKQTNATPKKYREQNGLI